MLILEWFSNFWKSLSDNAGEQHLGKCCSDIESGSKPI